MDYIKKKLISQTNLNVEWKFNPKQKEILPTGFIGLRNLGSTCYLNSFVQQIFMVPNFVRGVFDLKFPDFSEKQAEESLLYQTQSLGAYLMASKSRFVDPRKFINTIQTWDSSKINPFVQMDVEEFMNMFFDQFAREAKSTPQKNLIQETFGAKLTHQVIIQENYKINRRVEDYYSISLDIRQKNNLLESLKEYVAPEMLSGENQYYSEELGKKVDALKRVCFETLPQNLLVHLKRFEFDFETFVRHKINDRFEFPFELDMEPYTEQAVTKNGILQENINEDEYSQEKKIESTELIENDSDNKVNHVGSTHYELTGIIAHYGSAESGHYYSFIRKRDGSSAHSATWIRFDDTYTDFYDISNIEKDCFGGLETPKKQTNQDENFNPIPPMLKPYSAYILLYTRKDVLEREALEFQNQKNSSNLFSRVELPPHLSRDIWKENISFFRQKFIFDSVFLQFLSQLFQLQNPQITDPILANNPELTKLITDIVLQVVFRSRYTSQLENWIKILQKQFSRSMELCLWFFGNYILYDSEKKKNSGDWMETNMISCRHDDIRSSSIALFQSVMQAMFEHEKEEINEAIHSLISVQRFEWDEICKTEFDIFRQWNQICESVDQAVKIYGNWPITLMLVDSIIHNSLKNSNQMFLGRRMDILMSLLNIYPPLSQYLIMTNVISKFIDLNLNYYSPLQKRDANTANLSTNSLLQLFSSQFRECPESLEIIYKLIEGVDLSLDQVQNIEKDGETNENVQNKIPLVDRVMILKTNFPELMIKNRLSPDIMGRILARICMNNSIYTQKYVSFVLLHISQAQQSQIDIEKLFTLLSCFLETKDSLFDWKVEKICEFMVNINNSEFFSSQKTVYCLSNFRLKIAKHEEVFEWMIQHQEQWVMQFLISNQNGDIRREASFLLQIVIPNQNEEISDTKASQYYEMFQYLLGLLPNLQLQVYQHIKPREFPQPDSISPFPFEFFFLTDYFNILRKSMFNEISFSSFEDNFQHFWDLFIHLDSYKLSCDFNKLELLRIFDKCISQNQENVDYLIQDSRFPRFVGSFIDIQDNPSYSQYASAYLPLFLNLVFLCIERDPTVIDSIYSSPIANDVLDKTIFDPFYDSFSEKYFSIISKISSKINFRIQKIKAILTGERVKKHPKNALKFLDLLLGSDTLLLFTFTETQNGHNTLSDLLIERISLLEKDLEISKEKEKESKKESKSKSKKPTLNTRKNTSIQDSKRKFRSKRKVGDQARPKKAKSFQENERKPRKKFFFDDQLFDSNNSDPAALWKVTDLFFREITDSDLSLLKTTNLQETGLMDIPPLGELYKDKWAREDEKKTTTKKKRKSKRKGATGQTDTQSEQATDENFRNDQRRFFKMINEKNAQKNIGFEIPPEFTSSHNLVHRLLSAILVEDEDTSMEFLNKFKTNGIIDFQNENSPARNHSHDRRLGVPTSPLTPDLNQDKQNIDPTHSQKLNTQNDLDSYQNLSLEKKLEFELKSVGLINEPVDLSNRKDDQVCTKIRILQSQLADIVERNNRMKTEILQKALKQQQEDQERLKKEEQHKRFLAQYEELLAKNPSKKRSARNK
eukprot:Anaeramoba_ignava/c21786_g1_i1.p1 GENE.c21786_g1_i1~~c21786_g1_i1.p1  ORF type:complete len:1570 (+),score=522.18 c21786_g1_i1:3382-8091(+)